MDHEIVVAVLETKPGKKQEYFTQIQSKKSEEDPNKRTGFGGLFQKLSTLGDSTLEGENIAKCARVIALIAMQNGELTKGERCYLFKFKLAGHRHTGALHSERTGDLIARIKGNLYNDAAKALRRAVVDEHPSDYDFLDL